MHYEAQRQLLGTPNEVSQVAFELGYDDTSYFIRFFKKKVGATPEAFRKNFRPIARAFVAIALLISKDN